MEASTIRPPAAQGLRRFLGSRRGALTVAAAAAALAAVALVAYLNHYKQDVRGGTLPAQVLVADRLIPKGTSGDAVAAERLFRPTTLSEADVKPLAISDASALTGKVAVRDIYPGQQVTSADFRAGGDALRGRLAGTQRAIGVPLDEAHGLIGKVREGDIVDVFATFDGSGSASGVLRTIAQDVLVLDAPKAVRSRSSTADATVIVRMTDRQAARLAFAADNGKVWFALRPPAGGEDAAPSTVTQGTISTDGDR